jgi:hypothetical protein
LHHQIKKEIKDMVEAKLRVETLENRNNNNPFYGNSLVKKVTEETFCHDKDERKHIAPSGIKAVLKIENVVMDITINRYYLEHEATDDGLSRYIAFFSIEEKVYEVCVWFNQDNSINAISLSEWLQSGDFENGDDADNIYWSDEHFISWIKYLS